MRLYLLCSPVLLSVITAYSQIPMNNTIHTPYGNAQYTTYTMSPLLYYNRPNVSVRYPFEIVLTNDSTFTAKAWINNENKPHSIMVKSKGKKLILSPKDTKSITRTSADGLRVFGIPTDSCWLFRIYRGKINAYSFVAEPGLDYVIAIQKGKDGPIVPLTKENLLIIVGSDDPKINEIIEKGKFTKAIEAYNTKQ